MNLPAQDELDKQIFVLHAVLFPPFLFSNLLSHLLIHPWVFHALSQAGWPWKMQLQDDSIKIVCQPFVFWSIEVSLYLFHPSHDPNPRLKPSKPDWQWRRAEEGSSLRDKTLFYYILHHPTNLLIASISSFQQRFEEQSLSHEVKCRAPLWVKESNLLHAVSQLLCTQSYRFASTVNGLSR